MKKLAVVLGVAAVATLTGCRDQDYDAKHGKTVQDEVKSIETTPAKPIVPVATPTTAITPVATMPTVAPQQAVKPVEPETTVYIVQNGDYLAKVSKKYNVTISAIKKLNNLRDDKIRVGQKLKLPGKVDVGVQAAPAPAKAAVSKPTKGFTPYTGATKEYVVKNGDTLGAVAYGNGLNIRQLKQLNNLTGDALKVGQKLKVPAEKVTKTVAEKQAVVAEKQAEAEVKKAAVAEKQAEAEVKKAEAEVKKAEVEAKQAEAEVKKAEATPIPTTTYVVQEGEDLTRLSIDFGVSTSVIREMNNLGENDTIKPGQVLKLPAETQQ